jgi:hypothetical protein
MWRRIRRKNYSDEEEEEVEQDEEEEVVEQEEGKLHPSYTSCCSEGGVAS